MGKEKAISSINSVGKTEQPCLKNEPILLIVLYHTQNLSQKVLTVRPKTIKLPEGNISSQLLDSGLEDEKQRQQEQK